MKTEKVLEAAKVISEYCKSQRGCQNCIFRLHGADHWECHIEAFELQEVLNNIEAKRENRGYMNDNDIIKALECCEKMNCYSCPYYKEDCRNLIGGCVEKLEHDALNLINRLKAEIERLTVNMNAFGLGMKREKERADTARAEAIKEFAERIEPKLAHNTDISAVGYQSVIADIQSVVQEMTEGQNERH